MSSVLEYRGARNDSMVRVLRRHAPKGVRVECLEAFRRPPPHEDELWVAIVTCEGKQIRLEVVQPRAFPWPANKLMAKMDLIAP